MINADFSKQKASIVIVLASGLEVSGLPVKLLYQT